MELRVVDELGAPIPVRAHVRTSQNQPYPGYPDSTLLSHGHLGSYFYFDGAVIMDLPLGVTDITVGRGFEWRPVHYFPDVQGDTTLTVILQEVFDLSAEGWHCGDMHVHTQHSPRDYNVCPDDMLLIAEAEGMDQVYLMDGSYQFSGGPHPISSSESVLYYTGELRNQVYGHAALLNLKEMITLFWCAPPHNPPYPMLTDQWLEWGPAWDEAMVLAHPQTGGDFFADEGWPECGLARELPVQAALGSLDAMELLSYSNDPDIYLEDWYGLLSAGYQVPIAAGTDAVVCSYVRRPAGGYRVYVQEDPGQPHDPASWVQRLKAGRTFVTNYPLIPQFTVNGTPAGGQVDVLGPAAPLDISLSIRSVLPLEEAVLIRDGVDWMRISLPATTAGTVLDTTLSCVVHQSCWLALRVDGWSDLRHPALQELFAHTGAVFVRLDGQPIESTVDAARFQDWIDDLEIFVEARGNWESQEQRQHVLDRLTTAWDIYGAQFHTPPAPFSLLAPEDGDTLQAGAPTVFDWTDAYDPEPGDRVTYELWISPETLFVDPLIVEAGTPSELQYRPEIPLGHTFYWRVVARDRGHHQQVSDPPHRRFVVMDFSNVVIGDDPGPFADPSGPLSSRGRLRAWARPNPARDVVVFQLSRAPDVPFTAAIVDASGRTIASTVVSGARPSTNSAGLAITNSPLGPQVRWDGRNDQGQAAPGGCYWLCIRAFDTPRAPATPVATARVLLLR